jgi:hypothetical protein
MGDRIRAGDFLFSELNFDLLKACESGHRANVWTKPDLDHFRLYLTGFDYGSAPLGRLEKSENTKLVNMFFTHPVLYAEIIKEDSENFLIRFMAPSAEEVEDRVAEARRLSEDLASKLAEAEADRLAFLLHELQSPYSPKPASFEAEVFTPSPITFAPGDILIIKPKSVEFYARTGCRDVLLYQKESGKVGFLRAPSDLRKRVVRAHVNGHLIWAKVTAQGDTHDGFFVPWEEVRATVVVTITPQSCKS